MMLKILYWMAVFVLILLKQKGQSLHICRLYNLIQQLSCDCKEKKPEQPKQDKKLIPLSQKHTLLS